MEYPTFHIFKIPDDAFAKSVDFRGFGDKNFPKFLLVDDEFNLSFLVGFGYMSDGKIRLGGCERIKSDTKITGQSCELLHDVFPEFPEFMFHIRNVPGRKIKIGDDEFVFIELRENTHDVIADPNEATFLLLKYFFDRQSPHTEPTQSIHINTNNTSFSIGLDF